MLEFALTDSSTEALARPDTETAETPRTPFYLLGGHDVMFAIVNRFYDLMDSEPAYADLRAIHAADLTAMRASLCGFLTAWAGGPRDWFVDNPGKCMMSAHKAIQITAPLANQWAGAMRQAVADVAPENAELSADLVRVLGDMCQQMINVKRPTEL